MKKYLIIISMISFIMGCKKSSDPSPDFPKTFVGTATKFDESSQMFPPDSTHPNYYLEVYEWDSTYTDTVYLEHSEIDGIQFVKFIYDKKETEFEYSNSGNYMKLISLFAMSFFEWNEDVVKINFHVQTTGAAMNFPNDHRYDFVGEAID